MRISVHQQVAKSPPSSSSNCQSAPPAPLPSAVRDPTVVVVDAAGHRPTKRLQRSLGREAHSSLLIRVPFTTFPADTRKKAHSKSTASPSKLPLQNTQQLHCNNSYFVRDNKHTFEKVPPSPSFPIFPFLFFSYIGGGERKKNSRNFFSQRHLKLPLSTDNACLHAAASLDPLEMPAPPSARTAWRQKKRSGAPEICTWIRPWAKGGCFAGCGVRQDMHRCA